MKWKNKYIHRNKWGEWTEARDKKQAYWADIKKTMNKRLKTDKDEEV